jgi:hypothetical protein
MYLLLVVINWIARFFHAALFGREELLPVPAQTNFGLCRATDCASYRSGQFGGLAMRLDPISQVGVASLRARGVPLACPRSSPHNGA